MWRVQVIVELAEKLIPDLYKIIPCSYKKIEQVLPKESNYKDPASFKEEAEQIMNKLLSNKKERLSKFIIHTGGVPSCGKTYFCNYLLENELLPKETVFIQFDLIMEKLTGYKKDMETADPAKAFENWEIPAKIIGYELIERAIAKNLPILLDHGGSFFGHKDLLKNLKALGYTTEMHFINCSIDTALKRAQKRSKTQRHTPEEMILERHQNLQSLKQEYHSIVDKFYDYHNDTSVKEFEDEINKTFRGKTR